MPRVPCARRSNHNIIRPPPSTELNGISWRRDAHSLLLCWPSIFDQKRWAFPDKMKWDCAIMCLSVYAYMCMCVCVKYTFRNWLKPARESLLLFKRARNYIYHKHTKRNEKKNIMNTLENHTHTHSETHAGGGGGGDEVSFYVCPFRYNFICNLMKTVVFQNDNLYEWSITPGPGV